MACQYIVAVGFSAGGLKAVRTFFDHTPLDHAAYFIIQHLPFNYESQLKNILAGHSNMRIVKAEAGAGVEKNVVYLLPDGMYMFIEDQRIQLIKRHRSLKTQNRAIEIFFDSLVKEKVKNVIAVILSGNGNDGIRLLPGIREMGGFVIAQDPKNADAPSLPRNAIETGAVNFIARPEEMPSIIHEKIIPQMH